MSLEIAAVLASDSQPEGRSESAEIRAVLGVGMLVILSMIGAAILTRVLALGVHDVHLLRTLRNTTAVSALVGGTICIGLGKGLLVLEQQTYRAIALGRIIRRNIPREILDRLSPLVLAEGKIIWPTLRTVSPYDCTRTYRRRRRREPLSRAVLTDPKALPAMRTHRWSRATSPAQLVAVPDSDAHDNESTRVDDTMDGWLRPRRRVRPLIRVFEVLELDPGQRGEYRRQWTDGKEALKALLTVAEKQGFSQPTLHYAACSRRREIFGASRSAILLGFGCGFAYSAYRASFSPARFGHHSIAIHIACAALVLALIAVGWLIWTVVVRRRAADDLLGTSGLLDACFLRTKNLDVLRDMAANTAERFSAVPDAVGHAAPSEAP